MTNLKFTVERITNQDQLVFCQGPMLGYQTCIETPAWIVTHEGPDGAGYRILCEKHARKEVLELQGRANPAFIWCDSPTSKGEPCNAPPVVEMNGMILCAAHARKTQATMDEDARLDRLRAMQAEQNS